MVLAQSALERGVAGTVHACKVCKALGHGLQNCSSPGSGTPPPPPPPTWKGVRQAEGAEIAGQVAVTSPFHSHRGSVWSCVPDAGSEEGLPTPVVPAKRLLASCPGPTGIDIVLGVGAASGLATCPQLLQVASVSLDLVDSHLDELV